MSKLEAFLNPVMPGETKDIVISNRFINPETKEPVPFTIKTITQEMNQRIIRECDASKFQMVKASKQKGNSINREKYATKLCVACIESPDLANVELCDKYGVMGAEELLPKMLLPGEFSLLTQEIMDFNGFKGQEEIEDEVQD